MIINDGSTDNTNDVVQSLLSDDRVGYMSSSKNQGKWYCLNQAIEKLDCTFITSQDADDVSMLDRSNLRSVTKVVLLVGISRVFGISF